MTYCWPSVLQNDWNDTHGEILTASCLGKSKRFQATYLTKHCRKAQKRAREMPLGIGGKVTLYL